METLTAFFLAASIQYNLPSGLLESLCYVESKHNITAVHEDDGGSDSLGVCQVKIETAQLMGFEGTEVELMDPKVNIFIAAAYLSHQLHRYGDVTKAVIAYNRGSAGMLTSTAYSNKVMQTWGKYEQH